MLAHSRSLHGVAQGVQRPWHPAHRHALAHKAASHLGLSQRAALLWTCSTCSHTPGSAASSPFRSASPALHLSCCAAPEQTHTRSIAASTGAQPAVMTRGVVAGMRLPDAHAHPQDDAEHEHALAGLGAACVAVMGVKEEDWPNVERLQKMAPSKVIPCFGVHPWFAWQHATECNRVYGNDGEGSNHDAQLSMQPILEVPAKQDPSQIAWLVNSMPSTTWEPKLRALLAAHPEAVVGEFGIDRAAVVPGTRVNVTLEHQMSLVRTHMSIAAELRRPVSMHCVRAHGPLQELLQRTPAAQLPEKIMLHSFGGSPESVVQLVRLPGGVGGRLYFSFSAAINARDTGAVEKLVKCIAAVPDDRLLIESDQNTPLAIDSGLEAILDIVAQAKGWDLEKAAHVAIANFEAFYEGFLPPGYSTRA